MTKEDTRYFLLEMGIKKPYKTSIDSSSGKDVIVFATRGNPRIEDGLLKGSIIGMVEGVLDVWTSKVRAARVFTKQNNIALRELTGECYFKVPEALFESALDQFGAKIKRTLSKEHKERLIATLKSSQFASKHASNEAFQA